MPTHVHAVPKRPDLSVIGPTSARPAQFCDPVMATAVIMSASHVRPGPVPIAPSPSSRQFASASRSSSTQHRPQSMGENGRLQTQIPTQLPCDGCRRRNSRCAINERIGKCYSCEFHRQDCTFTPVHARKRSFDEASEGNQRDTALVNTALLCGKYLTKFTEEHRADQLRSRSNPKRPL